MNPIVCSLCKEFKATSEFTPVPTDRNSRGFYSWCKACSLEKELTRYHAGIGRQRKIDREIERQKLPHAKRRKRSSQLKKKFGITIEDYESMLAKQDWKCAICLGDHQSFNRTMHVDHCHATGKIRGILCNNCNLGIGFFKDSTTILMNAARYLK